MLENRIKENNKNNKNNAYGTIYMIVFIVAMILLRFVFELGSNIPTFIQSSIINEFFVNKGMSYEKGLSIYTSINLATSSVYVLTFLYKPLSDKIGRKMITIFNIIGIIIGFLCFKNSINYLIYAIGHAFIIMFIQNDIQMIYILETFNNKNNGKVFGLIKSFGILGLILIPVLRENAMHNNDSEFRNIFIIPLILSIVVLLIAIFFLKESKVFLNKDIKIDTTKQENKISLIESIKYIIKSKKLRIIVIAYTFYGLCSMTAYMYVESLMSINGMSGESITKALYVYPIVYAILSLLGGFLVDKIGRKKVVVTSGFLVGIGFIMFILAIKNSINPYLIGLLNGIYLGSYWVMGDYISFIVIENTKTSMRSSVMTAASILMMLGMIFGIGVEILLINIIGLTIASIIIIVPFSLMSAIIIMLKVKDTKGIDLQSDMEEN